MTELKNYLNLENASTELARLFVNKGFNNISITSDPDIVELSVNRKDKFPAIILKGPIIDTDEFTMGHGLWGRIIEKNIETMSYVEKLNPLVINVGYEVFIIGEEQTEVLNAMLNVLMMFRSKTTITVDDVIYNVTLPVEPDFNDKTESNDKEKDATETIIAKGLVTIEGLEINFDDIVSSGYLVDKIESNPSIKKN